MKPLAHWADDLLACEDVEMPDDLFDRVVALGERARPRLLEFVTDPAYRGAASEGRGYAPFHALEVLAALPPDDATAAGLVATLAADVEDDDVVEAIVDAIAAFGKSAVPHLVATLSSTEDAAVADRVASALALGRTGDDAAFEALRAGAERFPFDVTPWLGSCGDPRAIGVLRTALAARFVGSGSAPRSDRLVIDLAEAIVALGAELTDAESSRADLARLREERRAARDPESAEAPADDVVDDVPVRPFPNDPCPCGSGRKYKKCHEGDDSFDLA